MDLAKLTEKGILEVAGESIFGRGKAYYAHGYVHETFRKGMEIRAFCEGSRPAPYRVRAILGEEGIESATCNCPMDGFCKHIVAMLLKFVNEPDVFLEIPPLEDLLSSLDRGEMLSLISTMVECEPRLSTLVTRAVAAAGESSDLGELRQEIREAIQVEESYEIFSRLEDILVLARKLAKNRNWHGAGAIFNEVLREIASIYEEDLLALDDDGDISSVASDCVKGLEECLQEGEIAPDARRCWFETLLDALLVDINAGGVSFAEEGFDVLMDFAGEDDWLSLEEAVLDLIPGSGGWKRERLLNLLTAWRDKWERTEETSQIIRDNGSTTQRALLLVKEGRYGESLSLARDLLADNDPGAILELAEALVEAKAGEHAVELLLPYASLEKQHPRRCFCYLQWLAEYFRKSEDYPKALQWQRKVFFEAPSVEMYSVLQQLGTKMKVWEEIRQEILVFLEREDQSRLLIEIALYEEDVQRAINLLPRSTDWYGYRLRLDVARAAEDKFPLEAIKIYQKETETAIAFKERSSYKKAAFYLLRVAKLYEKLECVEEWEEYLASLKKRYIHFPALQDELKKAGVTG